MAKRLSSIYGLNIYSTEAEYVGEVHDVILNLDKGSIMNLCLAPLKKVDPTQVRDILTKDSVPYEDVTAVNDIILIKNKPTKQKKSQDQDSL